MYEHFLFLHNGLIFILPLKANLNFGFKEPFLLSILDILLKIYLGVWDLQEQQRPSWPSVLILNLTGQIINVLKRSTVSTRVQCVQRCPLVGIHNYEYIYHLFIVSLSHHLNIFIKNNNVIQLNGNRIKKF